jgi:ferredoxin
MSDQQVAVDHERCAGHGVCYAGFPELFDEDDYGHAVVREGRLSRTDVDDAHRAADNCPEAAIRIVPA